MTEERKDIPEAEDAANDEPVETGGSVGEGSLEKALEEEREKADRYLANWQRAEADLMNYKKRTDQEKADLADYARSTLVVSLLPVLDDLERALDNVPEGLEGEPWVDGVRLIYRKLLSALEGAGLCPMVCEGEEFDPNVHEAVMCVPGEEGRVVEEMQKGYKFCDRVLRPAMVKVGQSDKSSND